MRYAKITAGVPAPITLRELRAANPAASFPREPSAADLAPFGAAPIVEIARPTPSASQVVEDAGLAMVGAEVRQAWRLRDKTQAELDAEALIVLDAQEAAQVRTFLAAVKTDLAAARNGFPVTATNLASAIALVNAMQPRIVRAERALVWLGRKFP